MQNDWWKISNFASLFFFRFFLKIFHFSKIHKENSNLWRKVMSKSHSTLVELSSWLWFVDLVGPQPQKWMRFHQVNITTSGYSIKSWQNLTSNLGDVHTTRIIFLYCVTCKIFCYLWKRPERFNSTHPLPNTQKNTTCRSKPIQTHSVLSSMGGRGRFCDFENWVGGAVFLFPK